MSDLWQSLKASYARLEGRRTQILVGIAFVLNLVCFWSLPESATNVWKLAVQQVLILLVWTVAAKLDRVIRRLDSLLTTIHDSRAPLNQAVQPR